MARAPKKDIADIKSRLRVVKPDDEATPQREGLTDDMTYDNGEPTPWLSIGYSMRAATGMINAAGGTGKTQLTIQKAIADALGENFLHWQLNVPPMGFVRTAFVSGEENKAEVKRRVLAVCIHRCAKLVGHDEAKLRPAVNDMLTMLRGRLMLYAGKNVALITRGDHGLAERTKFHSELMRDACDALFDTIVLDPSIRLQRGFDENAAEIQELHNAVDDVATRANVGLTVVGHTRKSSSESVDSKDGARGHSSATDGARIVIVMARMGYADAKKLLPGREEERRHYVQIGDPKQSYAESSRRVWLRKVPVSLPTRLINGNHDSRFVLEQVSLVPQTTITDEQARQVLQRIKDGSGLGKRYSDAQGGKDECRADAMVAGLLGVGLVDARYVLRSLVERGQARLVAQPPNPKHPKRVQPQLFEFVNWSAAEKAEYVAPESDDEG